MTALLSLALPLSPRAAKALNTFSRRSRRAELFRNGSTEERDSVTIALPALPRSSAAALAAATKLSDRPAQIVLAELHEPVLLVAEQMVAEACAKMGQPLIDLGHPLLGGLVEPGAGAVEACVGPLQEPHLFCRKAERGAVLVQHGDPAEQHGVHHDRIPVPRHPQGDLLVDLQDRRIGVCRDQVVEHRRDLAQELARALQRRDGVGEVRHRGIVGDRGDLGGVVGEGLLEGRQEMLGDDSVERRGLERRLPGLEQRVVPRFRGSRGRRGFRHQQILFWPQIYGGF